jgi:signal peptidase II
MRPILLIVFPLYALDQLTKWLIVRNFVEEGAGWTVIPGFFDLVYFTNTGAAFSIFKNSNGFFIALSLVTLVVLGILFARGAFHDRWSRTAFALLLAGILGNLSDRFVHGHVIDFLLFDLHVKFAHPWPAFNVADSCICTSVGLFVIQSLREQKPRGGSRPAG